MQGNVFITLVELYIIAPLNIFTPCYCESYILKYCEGRTMNANVVLLALDRKGFSNKDHVVGICVLCVMNHGSK